MHVRLNGEVIEELDCFKYLASQVVADGECDKNVVHINDIMNDGYKA